VTIPITTTLFAQNGDFTVDGANLVTLEGTPGVRIMSYRSGFAGANDGGTLRLRNLRIINARLTGDGADANGAALLIRNQSANYPDNRPVVYIDNVTFGNNASIQSNPNARGFDFGGAIYIQAGDLYVRNSRFGGNAARGGAGGAIHVLVANLEIDNSTFTNNYATVDSPNDSESGFGGAIYVDGTHPTSGPDITIRNSTFEGNYADNYGGFAYINLQTRRGGVLTIENSRFINNRVVNGVQGWGGALSGGTTFNGGTSSPNDIFIRNSLFKDNQVSSATQGGDGGAIGMAQASDMTIENSIFVGNVAVNTGGSTNPRGRGGAIAHANGTLRIVHSTIVGNEAGWQGGGLFETTSSTQIINSIIANNTALNMSFGSAADKQNCSNTLSGSNNLQFPAGVNCTPGITIADPLLTGTEIPFLAASSPAIDSAGTGNCPATDYRGFTRPLGNGCDIGAIEGAGSPADADVNDDGLVSPADIVTILNGLGGTSMALDVDGNGQVEAGDADIAVLYLGERP
ncbi:MAG: choice-of-anchor Q domain-containing protein, partial [Chloroflexota bacterium]